MNFARDVVDAAPPARLALVALGRDPGGSGPNPGALCGITGLRPSHGAIPMDGVTALAPSFDTVGPLARTASDVRALFAALTACAPGARGAPPAEPGSPRARAK